MGKSRNADYEQDGEDLAQAGRDRTTSLPVSRADRGLTRPFYCRTCGEMQEAVNVPIGWYRLDRKMTNGIDRRTPGAAMAYQRLGLYCSAACLGQITPRLTAVEDDLFAAQAEGW